MSLNNDILNIRISGIRKIRKEVYTMSLKSKEENNDIKERITIRKRGQITLPKSFIEKFNLEEGDSLNLEVNQQGEIVVIPMVQVPASQKWFWTKEWQEGEREAEEDIKSGHVKRFDHVDDLIAELESDD